MPGRSPRSGPRRCSGIRLATSRSRRGNHPGRPYQPRPGLQTVGLARSEHLAADFVLFTDQQGPVQPPPRFQRAAEQVSVPQAVNTPGSPHEARNAAGSGTPGGGSAGSRRRTGSSGSQAARGSGHRGRSIRGAPVPCEVEPRRPRSVPRTRWRHFQTLSTPAVARSARAARSAATGSPLRSGCAFAPLETAASSMAPLSPGDLAAHNRVQAVQLARVVEHRGASSGARCRHLTPAASRR